MKLSGIHLILTFDCNFECDHCFVWGGSGRRETMTLDTVRKIIEQTNNLGSVDWVYFEGGEPFLYYSTLVKSVQMAAAAGFRVGVVTNAYWATSEEDALECLKPMAGQIEDLAVSSDRFHYDEEWSKQAQHAQAAADKLDIPHGVIQIAQPEHVEAEASEGQIPEGESAVMYRGRAAVKLAKSAGKKAAYCFTSCEHEDLRNPGRVHVDPLGYVHLCQGISVGNVFDKPLNKICSEYDPDHHPLVGPILAGGPVALAARYNLPLAEGYADSCHLCYEARVALRDKYPDILTPDQMYGGGEKSA